MSNEEADKESFGHHRVSIAGQVKDAITGKAIAGATVKIIDAPESFVRSVIIKAKFLPVLQSQGNKILQDTKENDKDKFKAFNQVIDCVPYHQSQSIPQLERTETGADGWFYFIDLPDGLYQLETSLAQKGKRYGAKQSEKIEVKKDTKSTIREQSRDGNLVDSFIELKLTPTTLLGKVTSADGKEAIGMAKVQIDGTSESTFSLSEVTKQNNREWNYRLIGIEASEKPLKVIVSSINHASPTQEINLAAGEVKSLDFQLQSK